MSDITINMKLFGAFRKFGESLSFSVPTGSSIANIKTALQDQLNGNGLVLSSVLANERTILQDSDVLENSADLSILPPVSGG